jgi:hypothetical protein
MKTESGNMSSVKEKLAAIDRKIDGIDEKMKQLMQQKKDLLQLRKDTEEQEILSVVRSNGSSLETIDSDMALIKLLKDNHLTKDDILELVAPQPSSAAPLVNTITRNGGQPNENR